MTSGSDLLMRSEADSGTTAARDTCRQRFPEHRAGSQEKAQQCYQEQQIEREKREQE